MTLDDKSLNEKETAMNTMTFRTKHVALAAVAALCFSSMAAYAGQAEDALPTRIVRYGDLTLATHAGVAALHNRIRIAAEQVCGDTGSRHMAEVVAVQACVARAIATSEQAVHQARLASIR